jgi:dienelactone hydrolase
MSELNRIAPAQGVPISDDKRAELVSGCETLAKAIVGLGDQALLPDVIVYYNAVQYAVEQDIFYDEDDVESGLQLIQQGIDRANALKEGAAPWATQTGLVVRGYRSALDDSIQPYGLVVPDSFEAKADRQHRLDIWHHGRNAKGSELRFLVERQTKPGRFTPADTFMLHTYGRYCNAMKFAGEIDTLEALAHAKSQYPIDDDRICMRGFSMGGAATWHQATHYAGKWVAATPGAGFAETAIYQNVAKREVQPPWWEQKLWGLYDATKVAGNLRQCSTIAYSGENDKQMQSSDIMSEYMAKEGLELPHIIGPGMGHAYDDGSKDEIERRLVPLVEQGKDRVPEQIRFTTYSLRYNEMLWVQVDGLEKHWERSDVAADIVDGGIQVKTTGITALTLNMSAGQCPFSVGAEPSVVIDGTEITGPGVSADTSWSLHLVKTGTGWASGRQSGLRKLNGLQGPIDDAFMDRFLIVTPSGTPMVGSAVTDWIHREQQDAIYQWKMQFRGDARVKVDREVTDEDLEGSHLILWGDPSSNAVLSRTVEKLPVNWSQDTLQMGANSYDAARNVPVLVYPNPLSPGRYVVLNSGFTFAPNGSQSNSTQTPKLPDWAILDIGVPSSERPQKGVVDCDFFGERWEVVTR